MNLVGIGELLIIFNLEKSHFVFLKIGTLQESYDWSFSDYITTQIKKLVKLPGQSEKHMLVIYQQIIFINILIFRENL
ncbi:conserved hypothetical protein ['Nostoc azollae' 0708]|jgi:hypothetical protein|uniref:Uncharacterized protein n=1 Tax=Nostoc azollae (strain 0708) TaxID=551115 RepID=D7E4T6_NOSA0|nr:conserved hypothetical protein ['Nostoc azollae' 0708]